MLNFIHRVNTDSQKASVVIIKNLPARENVAQYTLTGRIGGQAKKTKHDILAGDCVRKMT